MKKAELHLAEKISKYQRLIEDFNRAGKINSAKEKHLSALQ